MRKSIFYGAAFRLLLISLPNGALAAGKSADQTIRSLETRIVELNSRGQYAEAVPLARQVIELRRKRSGSGDADYAAALANLALLDKNLGRLDEAQPLLEESLAIRRKLLKPSDPLLASTSAGLAEVYADEGKLDLAQPLLEQAAGSDDPAVLSRLSDVYVAQKRPDDAAPLLQRAVAIRRAMGNEDKNLATRVGNLAALYASAGRYAESVPLWQENIALFEKIAGPDSVSVAFGLDNLAIVDLNRNDLDGAEPLLRRSAAIYLKAGGESDPRYLADQDRLARIAERGPKPQRP
jgi:tetratricopeptide (TPR) repeat protein